MYWILRSSIIYFIITFDNLIQLFESNGKDNYFKLWADSLYFITF